MYVVVCVEFGGEECFQILLDYHKVLCMHTPKIYNSFKEAKELLRDKQQRYPNALYAIYSLVPETGVNE